MGIINKLDKLGGKLGLNTNDIDDPDYDNDEIDDEEEELDRKDGKDVATSTVHRTNIPPRSPLGGGNVVNFTSVQTLRGQHAKMKQEAAEAENKPEEPQQPMKVVVIEPKTFDDSQQISQCLMEKRPVIVNFENTDSDVAHRIVDFVSGTVYALDGEPRKISRNVFLFAPSNVTLASDEEVGSFTDMTWLKK